MCITLCRHRALTQEEYDALPGWWHEAPAVDIAGGPLEVLWHRNVPDTPGTRPCHHPGKVRLGGGLWLPEDCGECEPCRARAEVRSLPGAEVCAARGDRLPSPPRGVEQCGVLTGLISRRSSVQVGPPPLREGPSRRRRWGGPSRRARRRVAPSC